LPFGEVRILHAPPKVSATACVVVNFTHDVVLTAVRRIDSTLLSYHGRYGSNCWKQAFTLMTLL
jgi:hypothetical protein